MRRLPFIALLLGLAGCNSSSTPMSPTSTLAVTAASNSTAQPATTPQPAPTPTPTPTPQPAPGSVIVNRMSTPTSVMVGDIHTMLASFVLANGNTTDVSSKATWTTSDAAVATITTSSGALVPNVKFTGLGPVEVRATYQGAVGSFSATVLPVSSVTVTGLDAAQTVGNATQLRATATLTDGTVTLGRTTWASSNEAIGTVSSSGVFTATGTGQGDISATINGITGAARATVVPAGSVPCTYAVTPTSHLFETGTSFYATVTAPAGCAWTYVTDVSWLHLYDLKSLTTSGPPGTSGASSGNGFVEVYFDWEAMMACNCGQTATVTIAGQKIAINNRGEPFASAGPSRR